MGSLEKVMNKIRSLSDYDKHIRPVTYSYGTAHNYYRDILSVTLLNDITIPILFISSLNDPVIK